MTKSDLKSNILELCGDDYYGVWEVYWNFQGLMVSKDVNDQLFIAVLHELADARKIVVYDKNKYTNEFERTTLDLDRLRSELKDIRAGNIAENLYWFSCS